VIRHAAVRLVLALALAGCTTTSGTASQSPPGEPLATGTAPAPGTSTASLAPRVLAPRDARGVAVCDLLTPEQQAAVEIEPATRTTALPGAAPRCQWRTRGHSGVLTVTSATDFPIGGLEGLYLVRGTYDVFEPDDLDGYPIVRADLEPGDTDCTIYVGVAEDQLVWAAAGFPFGDRSACAVARQMASYMISNLPPLR
jgi:hypothetical protein